MRASAVCHPARRRYVRGGLCRSCYDQQRFEKRPELLAKEKARKTLYQREYHQRNREKRLEVARARWHGNEESARRELTLFRRYGLTLDDYNRMLAEQGGGCAICKRPPRGKTLGQRLYVDHCHDTGKIRGLLCPGCNTALGQYRHDIETLMRAIAYLERANG